MSRFVVYLRSCGYAVQGNHIVVAIQIQWVTPNAVRCIWMKGLVKSGGTGAAGEFIGVVVGAWFCGNSAASVRILAASVRFLEPSSETWSQRQISGASVRNSEPQSERGNPLSDFRSPPQAARTLPLCKHHDALARVNVRPHREIEQCAFRFRSMGRMPVQCPLRAPHEYFRCRWGRRVRLVGALDSYRCFPLFLYELTRQHVGRANQHSRIPVLDFVENDEASEIAPASGMAVAAYHGADSCSENFGSRNRDFGVVSAATLRACASTRRARLP